MNEVLMAAEGLARDAEGRTVTAGAAPDWPECPRCRRQHPVRTNFDNLCDHCGYVLVAAYPAHPAAIGYRAAALAYRGKPGPPVAMTLRLSGVPVYDGHAWATDASRLPAVLAAFRAAGYEAETTEADA